MKYRKLRIAWSVLCAIACLLLIVLWVRSSSMLDLVQVRISSADVLSLGSADGVCYLSKVPSNIEPKTWNISHVTMAAHNRGVVSKPLPAFGVRRYDPNHFIVSVAHWAVSLLAALVAGIPWLRLRFSLRTLLIGMTVAAIGLGWIVYANRN